jgi:WD40 repeat protein
MDGAPGRVHRRPVTLRRPRRRTAPGAPTPAAVASGVVLLCLLAACGATPRDPPPPGERQRAPHGFLTGTAWLPDGRIYFARSKDLLATLELWRLAPGRRAERVPTPQLRGCRRTEYRLATALPDGRLALERDCTARDAYSSRVDVVALDPRTRRMEMLLALGRRNPSAISWRRDGRSGYVAYSGGFCSGIAPFTRAGLGRFRRPVTVDGHTWQLDRIFRQSPGSDCTSEGRADQVVLSGDGRTVVFLASPESQGSGGIARLDHPWNLYVWAPSHESPRRVVEGFDDHRGLALSPDGRTVAVSGRRDDDEGLWLIHLRSGRMETLGQGELSGPSFSPDGDRLAVIRARSLEDRELRVVSVPGVR